jgi:aspartate racemase
MKTIGLLGGMSWESTALHYHEINEQVKAAHQIEAAVSIPLLHIADATAEAVEDRGISTIGLLGTRFTMQQDFYAGRLREKHGLSVLIPEEADRSIVHNVIYDELVLGEVKEASRSEFLRIMEVMKNDGAQGVILGCTEIGMLVGQSHTDIPLFDTALIHASKTVEMALDSANS